MTSSSANFFMTKKLNTNLVTNELKDSLYFSQSDLSEEIPHNQATVVSRHHDTTVPSKEVGHAMSASLKGDDDFIARVRRSVRSLGREAATLRLSLDEKHRLDDLVFTLRRNGRRTTATELIRIALNLTLEDYAQHGAASKLAQVLQALDA